MAANIGNHYPKIGIYVKQPPQYVVTRPLRDLPFKRGRFLSLYPIISLGGVVGHIRDANQPPPSTWKNPHHKLLERYLMGEANGQKRTAVCCAQPVECAVHLLSLCII